ncbi:DUF5681 domain-containing protein [Sphingosinicella sp. BN140058]|uniref:DUF5681 domain-containing protein n=1 Tax=Sphingosinicella sp. BN140058 TaxID=1892855 RepID=UPI001980BA46|nr:DUF5681 domain-containing protein [Sphingosinicella sp. BN140058]
MPNPAAAFARATTGQFLPGRSGNPAGRPRGARNKASRLLEMLSDGEEEAIARAVIERALAGEWPALRACFTRLMPPAKSAAVEIDLPDTATRADVAEAGSALIAAMAAGEITPLEAEQVMKLLTAHARLIDSRDRASHSAENAGKASDAAAVEAAASAPEACAPTAPEGKASGAQPSGNAAPADAMPHSSDPACACISPVFTVANRTSATTKGAACPDESGSPAPAPACISPVFAVADRSSATIRGAARPGEPRSPSAVAAQRQIRVGSARPSRRAALLAGAALKQGDTGRHPVPGPKNAPWVPAASARHAARNSPIRHRNSAWC